MAQKKIDPSVCHPDYKKLEKNYDLCEDVFAGDVKEYVPHLPGQTDSEFDVYINRTGFYNMVDKSTVALVGALTRKPYTLNGLTEFPVNEYGNGTNFIQSCYRDLLLGARISILVDVDTDGRSMLVPYDADDIINWRGDGTQIGDFVVIEEETYYPDPENPFEMTEVKTWRQLYIDDSSFYAVRIWSKDGKNRFTYEDIEPLTVSGVRLQYIPLWTSNTYDNTWDVYNPPLLTQAKINIEHFRKATDIAHYEFFMALPTLTITGDLYTYTDQDGNQTNATVLLGSTKQALHLTMGSDAKFTEVSGSSHATLRESLNSIEERLYVAGSRLLTNRRGVESAEALQIRSGSESAVLDTLVHALQGALNPALELCGIIDNAAGESSIELNKDFTAIIMAPADVKSLLEVYATGTITLQQFLDQLYEGDVVKPVTSLQQ